VKKFLKISISKNDVDLYSLYARESNELATPSPRLSAKITQLLANIAKAVAG